MVRSALSLAALSILATALTAVASPLSVRIDDHTFTFDVPYSSTYGTGAQYSYNGASPDTLTIVSSDPNHYVASYSYEGKLPTVPANGPLGAPPVPYPFVYPVICYEPLVQSLLFGGSLDLDMTFTSNDGPYIDPNTNDRFDISLVGNSGSLTIVGRIHSPLFPFPQLYPSVQSGFGDVVLLDIDFSAVSLLARAGTDRIDLVEGMGKINSFMGYDVSGEDMAGVVIFKFFAENPQAPMFGADYQPTDAVNGSIMGHITGEAGMSPEPATMGLLLLSGLGVLFRRNRR